MQYAYIYMIKKCVNIKFNVLFNQVCINKKLLTKYTYIYLYLFKYLKISCNDLVSFVFIQPYADGWYDFVNKYQRKFEKQILTEKILD